MVRLALAALAAASLAAILPASAAELRVACYSDGNECETADVIAKDFTKANPDITIHIEKMPYKAILESLPVQLAAGNGPDIARVTDFGATGKYLLDLRPYLPDAAMWEQEF